MKSFIEILNEKNNDEKILKSFMKKDREEFIKTATSQMGGSPSDAKELSKEKNDDDFIQMTIRQLSGKSMPFLIKNLKKNIKV